MSQPQSRESTFELVGTSLLNIFCEPCMALFMGVQAFRRRKPTHPTNLYILPSPPSLPKDRIDIRQRPLAEQPLSCLMFRLPLELRQCIYEAVLGGNVIKLKLIRDLFLRGHNVIPKQNDTSNHATRAFFAANFGTSEAARYHACLASAPVRGPQQHVHDTPLEHTRKPPESPN
ncbi:hypothetical protein C8R44DRAFT_850126 [Mycena epipterygia]|nr:hypothetical protein C8R44DRAFT_850126 [Mycena epipterygia]